MTKKELIEKEEASAAALDALAEHIQKFGPILSAEQRQALAQEKRNEAQAHRQRAEEIRNLTP